MHAVTKQKVLIISSEFPPDVGGIGNHAYNLAAHLSNQDFEVTVLADIVTAKLAEKEIARSTPFTFHPVSRARITAITYFERIFKAIKFCKRNEVIICSGKFSLWLVQLLKALYPKKKYIAVVHGSELQLKNKTAYTFTHAALKKFDKIIAVSHFTKSLLPKSILQSSAVEVIPNGINTSQFVTGFVDTAQVNKQSISIVTIGSVTERKGQENVIEAMPEMIKLFPSLHYHIIGKPVLQTQLMQLINSLKLNGLVTFHGLVSHEQLISLLEQAQVKIMLSNNTGSGDVEGFGISILEANAMGKPAIGSKNTGIEDAIKDGVTGKLVDAKDTKAVAEALLNIIDNYPYYSANALQWAKDHDWKIIIKKYIEVIQNRN